MRMAESMMLPVIQSMGVHFAVLSAFPRTPRECCMSGWAMEYADAAAREEHQAVGVRRQPGMAEPVE
jgi:hypothetical protein